MNWRRLRERRPGSLPLLMLAMLLGLTASALFANDWDERIEGTLPLPTGYTFNVADPNSGITSIVTDTGEVALHLEDTSASLKNGRINRGNWSNVSGVTVHARFRVLYGENVMTLQLNDGLAEGRISLRWSSGGLGIQNATPDPGKPASIPMPANTWLEVWLKISNYRYWLYTFQDGSWNLASVGATSPPGTGGAVYIGSSSIAGTGAMDLDFWRLETTGGYAPGESGAPCIAPEVGLPVTAGSNCVLTGEATTISVGSSQSGFLYQLRKGPGDVAVGSPVAGTGGPIAFLTGPLTSTTRFNVLASYPGGDSCSQQLTQTQTVVVAEPVSTIAEAKDYPDGTAVRLSAKPVSAHAASSYWIEETDRSSGIRVNSNALPISGTMVTVTGVLGSSAGERYLDAISESSDAVGPACGPLFLTTRALGGSMLNQHTPGVASPKGPNNIGLLVKVWGRVTAVGDGYYYVDDGAGLMDGTVTGTAPNIGVRVLGSGGTLNVGDYTPVTGVSTCFKNSADEIQRAIRPVVLDCVLPNANLPVFALASAVCYGQSTVVAVSETEVGVNYQLRNSAGNVGVGAPVPGNGGTISLPTGPLTSAVDFNVAAMNAARGCSVQLASTATVDVNPVPNSDLAVGAALNPLDPGQSTSITVALSETGVSYQLRDDVDDSSVGGPVAGNGATINLPTGLLNATTTFNVLATRISSGCSVQLASVKTIHVGEVRSKIGVHVVCCSRNGYDAFLQECSDAAHPVALVKAVDDFSACNEAKRVNPVTLAIGRVNEINGYDLQGLDYLVDAMTPQEAAQWYYGQVKPKWLENPWVDVWECCNEWSWHWAWQADFYIAMMDLAEADGFRIGIWSCSGGNPPEEYYPEIARACARAKAHGNHILCLHEYSWDGLLKDEPAKSGSDLVLRYRRLYDYLIPQNADCPLALTEVGENGGGGFVGPEIFVDDFAWYDSEMQKDPYVIGCAAWTLGDWGGANFQAALPLLADYISTH